MPITVGRVVSAPIPLERPPTEVLWVEAVREQRVEEREHERAVVAPGARRLVVAPVTSELDRCDRCRALELVGHPDRIADQVAPDGPRESVSEIHLAFLARHGA